MKKSEKEKLKKAFNIPEPERKEEFVRKYIEKIKKNSLFNFTLFFRYASTVAFAVLIIGVWNYTSKTANFRNIEVNDPEYMTTVTTAITSENAPPDSTEQKSETYTTLKSPEIQKPQAVATTTSEMTSVYYSSPLVTSAIFTTSRQEPPTTITKITTSQQPTEIITTITTSQKPIETVTTTTAYQQPTEIVTTTTKNQEISVTPVTTTTKPMDSPPQTKPITPVTTTSSEEENSCTTSPAGVEIPPPAEIVTTTKFSDESIVYETTSKTTKFPVDIPEITTTSTTTETTTTITTTTTIFYSP